MMSAMSGRVIVSVLLSAAGWSLLLMAFTLLGLTLVLFATSWVELIFHDARWMTMIIVVFLMALLSLVCSLALIQGGRSLRRTSIKPGLCPKCGYDLRGHDSVDSTTCPECGQ
jgi:hypothetical protein